MYNVVKSMTEPFVLLQISVGVSLWYGRRKLGRKGRTMRHS